VGNTDERENLTEELESASDDVEAHGLTGTPTDAPAAERASDEADDDFEAHGMIGAPTDAPTD
jgi:hypothetical protein